MPPWCEKYDIERDEWYTIADLPFGVRNPSACALTADTVYLFGGKSQQGMEMKFSDKILLYIISSNLWLTLPIKMPKCALTVPIKINDYQIALFGGLAYIQGPNGEQTVGPSTQVLLFDVRLPSITYAPK